MIECSNLEINYEFLYYITAIPQDLRMRNNEA